MFRHRYLVLVFLVGLAPGGGVLRAQTLSFYQPYSISQSQSGDFKLEGTVINALTGDPLSRALVQLLSPANRVVMSGPDGRFQFEGLPQGQANFSVLKPGFMVGDGNRGGVVMLKTLLTVDAHTQPVTLKMVPQSVLTGHVADTNGEALENTIVRVFRMTVRGGRKIREVVQQKATDEEGNFRIAGLPPGRYYIAVQPRANSFTLFDASKPKLGYPVNIFYPAATDFVSATPIDLAAGATAHLEFSAGLERVFDVSGTIAGYGQGQGLSVFTLDASGDPTNLGMRINPQAGTFELRSVPSGVYTIRASAQDGTGHQLSADTTVNVTANVTGVRIVLEPSLDLEVVVRNEFSRGHPELESAGKAIIPVNLSFHSDNAQQPDSYPSMQTTGDPSTFILRSLSPGKYRVAVNVSTSSYVQSAHCGSTDLLREELVLARGAPVPPIEIVLRDDMATLTMALHSEDSLLRAAVLVMQDSAPMQSPRLVYGFGGDASLSGLAPGGYRMFAVDSVEQLEYMNPEVLAQYAAKAVQVNLAPNGQTKISLDVVHTGE
jgi:Carboxypeptidase regulatory-like domain